MLGEMMKPSFVQLDVNAKDFEDAIRKSTIPYIREGVVDQSYVDAIIRIYHETGPYIVLTPNVALPHAPGEAGAKEVALGFTRLTNPVVSGNEANDPVKYLFPLSAPDSTSHISLLAELANYLGDEKFIAFLEEVKSAEEFIQYLKEKI